MTRRRRGEYSPTTDQRQSQDGKLQFCGLLVQFPAAILKTLCDVTDNVVHWQIRCIENFDYHSFSVVQHIIAGSVGVHISINQSFMQQAFGNGNKSMRCREKDWRPFFDMGPKRFHQDGSLAYFSVSAQEDEDTNPSRIQVLLRLISENWMSKSCKTRATRPTL